jgi:hypothetical protein
MGLKMPGTQIPAQPEVSENSQLNEKTNAFKAPQALFRVACPAGFGGVRGPFTAKISYKIEA